jgi:ZIP family zinc transporter/zinc and cadmium transporter
MPVEILPILLAVIAAAANVAGGAIVTVHRWAHSSLRYFVALGSGFMLGAVFLEMIPESLNVSGNAPGWILAGYLVVHMFEHTLSPHLHFGEETHHDEVGPGVGVSALIGLAVHTFFDGVAIGAGFQVSPVTGMLIFVAVLLHKIVDGFTVASIALTSGFSRRFAFGSTVVLGLATVLGVLTVGVAGSSAPYALPISAGAMLYVAASDLIPEVNHEPGVKLAIVVFLGVAFFLLLTSLGGWAC